MSAKPGRRPWLSLLVWAAVVAPLFLLLRFLNELVYLRDAEQLLLHAGRLRVESNERARLDAELWGEPLRPERHALATEVKAATAHALRVRATADGWEASVTLDV